jgi:hypothetical protein
MVLIVGGINEASFASISSAEIYDPATGGVHKHWQHDRCPK